jgi:hypothetical protein
MTGSISNSPTVRGCTLLVASCDAYQDLWRPYFELLRRYWPDCPFPVALITEAGRPSITGVRALALGSGLDWSVLLLRALDAVGTPYVLLTLEDFFLRGPVNTARVLDLYDDAQRRRLRMLRLVPRPGPTTAIGGVRDYGSIAPGSPYRVSTQAAFWDVSALRALLMAGESAWAFEVNGSLRSASQDGFAAVWRAALPYRHHVIERGKWFPWAARQFARMDIGVDLTARPIMTTGEAARWMLGKALGPVAVRMPRPVRQVFKPLARRAGFLR